VRTRNYDTMSPMKFAVLFAFLLCGVNGFRSGKGRYGSKLKKPPVTSLIKRESLVCPPEKPFVCRDGLRCLRVIDVCDGYTDCIDRSDELQCDAQNPATQLPAILPPIAQHAGCPSGFIDVSVSKKCYKLILTEMSWSQAGWHCASTYGAHLVFIGNGFEQTHLSNLLNSHPETIWWTGGERLGNDWGWKYHCSNGTIRNIPIRYTNWANGEPNNKDSSESCIAIMKMAWWEGRWNDDSCTVPRRFICEIDVLQN